MRTFAAASIICVAVALTCCTPPTRSQPETVELEYTIRDLEEMPVEAFVHHITPAALFPDEEVIPDSDTVFQRMNAEPGNERLKFHYGVALVREGDWEEGCPLFDLEYSNEAISGAASYFQGYCLIERGDFEGAAESFARYASMERDPETQAHMFTRAGMICWQIGERGKAIPYFEQAMEHDEGAYEAAYYLGVYRAMEGDYETAIELLIQAHDYSPQISEDLFPWRYAMWHALGVIAYNQGELQLAREHWEHALQLYPEGEDAKEGLQLLRPTHRQTEN